MPFVRLASLSELEPDQGFQVELGDEAVALVRASEGGVYAVIDVCSHEEYPLSEGWVEDHTIGCACGSRFDLSTGEPAPRRPCARCRSSRCGSRARTCWSTCPTTGPSWQTT